MFALNVLFPCEKGIFVDNVLLRTVRLFSLYSKVLFLLGLLVEIFQSKQVKEVCPFSLGNLADVLQDIDLRFQSNTNVWCT